MPQITWNTDVNAPCCPGEIVNHDGRTILIQTDWDFPGVARTFGWDMSSVVVEKAGLMIGAGCLHEATDGTVPCRNCKLPAGDFIAAAYDWLCDNDGATAEDPGYFSE